MQTRVEDPSDRVIMRFRGRLVDYLCDIAPEVYKPFIHQDKHNNKVLYCEVMNVIYGTMKAAILFYKKLNKDLNELGFECNPYDPCVMNRNINGVQQTVVFHVDDVKASCINKQENETLIEFLKKKYEIEGLPGLKVNRGKEHDFLGMKLDFSKKGKVIIDMKKYVSELIVFSKKHAKDNKSKTPASDWLFQVRDDSKKLDKERKEFFSHGSSKGIIFMQKSKTRHQHSYSIFKHKSDRSR